MTDLEKLLDLKYHVQVIGDIRRIYDMTKQNMESDGRKMEFRVKAHLHAEQLMHEALEKFSEWVLATDVKELVDRLTDPGINT